MAKSAPKSNTLPLLPQEAQFRVLHNDKKKNIRWDPGTTNLLIFHWVNNIESMKDKCFTNVPVYVCCGNRWCLLPNIKISLFQSSFAWYGLPSDPLWCSCICTRTFPCTWMSWSTDFCLFIHGMYTGIETDPLFLSVSIWVTCGKQILH